MNYIKNKIKAWIGIFELLKSYKLLLDEVRSIDRKVNSKLSHNEELIKSFLSSCETGYDLGASKHHKNWCVFAVQGKSQDYVKFIDLSHLEMNEIKDFEKYLSKKEPKRNSLYDAPHGVKDYFIYR